ncbi:MAG: hypothetical protein GF330_10560 [Candidatus Eisenbacteria bacterium]|nr:hypothetical protein [Candidatus Eisenbacteria bacterium]
MPRRSSGMTDRVENLPGRTAGGRRTKRGRPRESEVRALISLLADDEERIFGMVQENLLRLGEGALPLLAEASEDPDPRLRLRARHVAAQIHRGRLEQSFRDQARQPDGEFDLEEGLVAVARIEYPELEREEIAVQLEELADRLRLRLPSEGNARQKVAALNEFLFRDLGFRGNRQDYSDPDNSFLNKVLERRLGIPISLSALTILIGRRAGLPLFGVGLPKHFLVKYRDGGSEIYIDPFSRGRILSRRECSEILTSEGYFVRESFMADYLAVSTARDIIIRMLRNLMLVYSRRKNRLRVKRLTRYVDILGMRDAPGRTSAR